MWAILVIIPILFFSQNEEFFKLANKQMEEGATWHQVGPQAPDPKAKSITLQCIDPEGEPCGDPYIIWKLKKSDKPRP